MSTKTQDYSILEDGFIHGVWHTKGQKIPLTEAQARLFLDHGRIAPVKADAAKGDAAKAKA